MSLLFPRNSNIINYNTIFNKEEIIEEIKEKLPEPWLWYTIGSSMDSPFNPKYDLLIIRNKDVREEINHHRPFSSFKNTVDSVYSLVLGVNIVDRFSTQKKFDIPEEDALVTAVVEVNSAVTLFNILRDMDSQPGGIENGN